MIRSTLGACLLTILAALAACNTSSPVETGGAVTPVYTPPVSYQDHRDQQQVFEVDGYNIAYTDHGEGPVLVLLHGVPTSSWMYRKIIPELQASLRVISVDLLGFGSSDKPGDDERAAYARAAQAGRVQALMAHLGIEQYGVLMHDMGGVVAWEMVRSDPSAISHLVVLNTIVNQTGFNHPSMAPGFVTRRLIGAYGGDLSSRVVLDRTFNDLGLTGEFELSEEECFGYVLPMREGADPALYAFFTSINDEMFDELEANRAIMKVFQGEAVVLWGAKDEVLTTGQIPILKDMLGLDDNDVHIYENNAHFLAEEIPGEIVSKVKALMLGSTVSVDP